MKYVVRLYRLCKPVAVYTSYLFTALSVGYLLAQAAFPERIPFHAGMMWGLLFFYLGSILAQRLLLGSTLLEGLPYTFRLFLYLCTAGIWGSGCLYVSEMLYETGTGPAVPLLMLFAGLLGCGGFELFNRCRAHMYNALLEQYKRRKQL